MIVYALVRSVIAAATKDFWYDELLTLAVSSLARLEAAKTLCEEVMQNPVFVSGKSKFR